MNENIIQQLKEEKLSDGSTVWSVQIWEAGEGSVAQSLVIHAVDKKRAILAMVAIQDAIKFASAI